MTPPQLNVDDAVDRARGMVAGGRRMLGITGPPGSGKSTLAAAITETLRDQSVAVPMDGFHLADVQLERLRRVDRKGAPDTFDVWGYLALLARLRRSKPGEVVYAPGFERTLEQPIAASIAVEPTVPLVVTEGNYLLLDYDPWPAVAGTLDEIWWVDVDPAVRRRRLVARHVEFGKAPDVAERWVESVDERNARAIEPGRARADIIVRT